MKISKIAKHPSVISLVAILTLVSAAALEWAGGVFITKPLSWAYAAGLIAFIIICTSIIFGISNRLASREMFDEKISDIKNIIVASNMSWLVNDKYVRVMENNASDIWVFTPDMSNDINKDCEVFSAVKSNLEDGKDYTYFVPRTTSINGAISKYKRLHKFGNDQVIFCLIPAENYFFYTEAVIYNVRSYDKRTIGIEWLPVSKLNYYVEMDESHTDNLVAVGETLLTKYLVEKLNNGNA